MARNRNEQALVYVAAGGTSEGIYVYRMDPSSGSLTYASKATGLNSPSFLAIDPRERYLYAVHEAGESADGPSGAVSALSIARETGELTYLNSQSSGGAGPCHVIVDRTGRCVLVANYPGGSVAVLPILGDGRLGEATGFVQHHGSSVNPERQEGPHAHSIMVDADNRFAFSPDLGQDKVLVYRLDVARGKLAPNQEPWARVKPGAGPRHMAFHPNGRYVYVINELDSTLSVFSYDGTKGTLRELETVPTVPGDFDGTSYCADVHVAPSGRFVYGSNRGHDSIVIFAISEATGRLTLVGHEPTQGKWPRNFAIDATGRFLLAANQHTDSIVTFRIDRNTGKLEPTGHVTEVSAPLCVKLVPLSP